ncbi:FkbM family methyltransferase [Planctomycetota bacterium]
MIAKVIDSPRFSAVVKGRYGYIVFNKNDIYIGKAIEKYGEYSESEVSLFRQVCKEGDIVVDVGANIGTHTLALSGLVGEKGRVYAYEPQRIVFQTLCANMAINSIENVECYQMAVSSEDGFVLIPNIRYDIENNFGGLSLQKIKTGYKVPSICLDNFLDIPKLKLLKIDVEGMEHKVINGSINLIEKHKPVLYVENDVQEKSKGLIELIWSLNYRAYWHLPPLFNPDNFAGDTENIYPGILSVNMLCLHNSENKTLERFSEIIDSDYHPIGKK